MPYAIPPGAYRADLALINPFTTSVAGEARALRVALRNLGSAAWSAAASESGGPVTLGVHLHRADGTLISDTLPRVALPYDVPPGAGLTLTLALTLDAALPTGEYTVYIDLVVEGLGWFAALGDAGAPPLVLPITVQAPDAEPAGPAAALTSIAGRALGEMGLRAPSAGLLEPVARALHGIVSEHKGER
jgi:hypothetical protein